MPGNIKGRSSEAARGTPHIWEDGRRLFHGRRGHCGRLGGERSGKSLGGTTSPSTECLSTGSPPHTALYCRLYPDYKVHLGFHCWLPGNAICLASLSHRPGASMQQVKVLFSYQSIDIQGGGVLQWQPPGVTSCRFSCYHSHELISYPDKHSSQSCVLADKAQI